MTQQIKSDHMKLSIKERARRYLAKCPAAISGHGGHTATFLAAVALAHGFALPDQDVLDLLREWNRSCRPPWSEAELAHKVMSAAHAHHTRPRGFLLEDQKRIAPRSQQPMRTSSPSPVFDPVILRRIAAAAAIEDVVTFTINTSPIAVDTLRPNNVLRRLYTNSGEKVLLFSDMKSQGQMLWTPEIGRQIGDDRLPSGPDGVWFLPQPVDGRFHPNPRLGGKRSRRSEESVTCWQYTVLESDEADTGDWLRCLIQLPLPIVSICESGGRSIHALVKVQASSKADWDAKIAMVKPVLVTLGADPAALSAVRLTRLPQARRGDRLQRLLYSNPSPDCQPILSRTNSTVQ
jgi:hypothetical protein